jgi:hypothetical protein
MLTQWPGAPAGRLSGRGSAADKRCDKFTRGHCLCWADLCVSLAPHVGSKWQRPVLARLRDPCGSRAYRPIVQALCWRFRGELCTV